MRNGRDVGRTCWRRSRAIINTSGPLKAANNYNLSECCKVKTHLHEHAQQARLLLRWPASICRLGLVICLVFLEKMMMVMVNISLKKQSSHHMALKWKWPCGNLQLNDVYVCLGFFAPNVKICWVELMTRARWWPIKVRSSSLFTLPLWPSASGPEQRGETPLGRMCV